MKNDPLAPHINLINKKAFNHKLTGALWAPILFIALVAVIII